jgi:hypothetical protein
MAAKYLFKEIIMYYEEFDPQSVRTLLASDALIQNVGMNQAARRAYNLFRQTGHLEHSVISLTQWIDDVTFIAREERNDIDIACNNASTTGTVKPVMMTEHKQSHEPVDQEEELSEDGGDVASVASEPTAIPEVKNHKIVSFLIGGSRPFSCCPDCGGPHNLPTCKPWGKNSHKDRKKSAFKYGACYRCLKGVHTSFDCDTEEVCAICGSTRHHTLLHEDRYAPKKPAVVTNVTTTPRLMTIQKEKLSTLLDLLSTEEREKVLKDIAGTVLDVVLNGVKAGGVNLHVNMKTPASDKLRTTGLKNYRKKNRIMPIMTLYINMVCYRIVAVYAKVGSNKFRVNMLMDDGSCSSFITRLLCDWLGITGKGKPNPLEVGFLGGSSAVEDSEIVTIQLESLDGTLITTVELNRVEEINDDIPIPDFNKMKAKFKYLKDLYFPKLEDAPVMILLGFDHASKQAALTPDKVGPSLTDPTGRTTAFGNTILYGAKRGPAVQLFGTESQEETQKVSNHH